MLWDEEQAWLQYTNTKRDKMNVMSFIERLFWTIIWVLVALFIGVWLLRMLGGLPDGLGSFFQNWGRGLEYQS